MTDLDRLLRRLDDVPTRDVWPRVGAPGYGAADVASSIPSGRRLAAAITAIGLGIGGIGLAYVAWEGSPTGAVRSDPGALVVSAAFSGGEPSLFYVTEDGRPVPLAETSGASSPVVSPDGRLVAYERALPRGRSALTVLRLSVTGPPRDLIQVDGTSLSPAWSPEGSRIAIVNQGEIWLVPVDGTEPGVLHVDDAFPRSVAWSPDGDRLAYTDSSHSTMLGGCLAEGSTGIWLISPEAPRPRHLTHDGCWSVAWSPLQSSIVASGSGFAPVLVDAETGTTRQIAGAPDSAAGVPGLSADGRLVGFPTGVEGLWIHDLVSGGWQRLPVDPDLEVQGVSFLPEGAPIPSVVGEEVCDFPDVRPTYLPWLGPGEPIPQPTMTTWAAGGGPQGLDSGYSILSWSNGDVRTPGRGRDVVGVTLWRATESGDSFPESNEVPPLPDGSTGRLHAGNDLD